MARAVKNVKTELENVGLGLPKCATTQLSQGYRPKSDQTGESDAQQLKCYQGQVGCCVKIDLRTWASGRTDYVVFPYVTISHVCKGGPISAVVPCFCVSETVQPVNNGV